MADRLSVLVPVLADRLSVLVLVPVLADRLSVLVPVLAYRLKTGKNAEFGGFPVSPIAGVSQTIDRIAVISDHGN